MPRLSPPNKAFRILRSIAEYSYSSRVEYGDGIIYNPFNDILLVVNNPDSVLEHSRIMHDGRQLRQRMELQDSQILSLYDDNIIKYLKTLAAKKKDKDEVDGAMLVDGKGRVLTEYGTREILSSPEMVERIKGKMVAGTGRRALLRASTLPRVSGLMFSEGTFNVYYYTDGKRVMLFDPIRDITLESDDEVPISLEDHDL